MSFLDLFRREPKKKRKVEVKIEPLCIGKIRGQETVKVGLLIAACGRHNVLLVGPPGEGKTALVQTMPGFLPQIDSGEYLQLCSIYMFSGKEIPKYRPLICVGPTVTESALIGGGRKPTPGLISLAHGGILFMDELPEYDRGIIEALRGPLESGVVDIARGGENKRFPCNIQLIAAMNPCKCGNLGTAECTCSEGELERYKARISGPILDRIDMVLTVEKLDSISRFAQEVVGQSKAFKLQVDRATAFRVAEGRTVPNKDIPGHEVFEENSGYLRWSSSGLEQFKAAMDRYAFSTRKSIRVARVARTVADLLGQHEIREWDVDMACEYANSYLLE